MHLQGDIPNLEWTKGIIILFIMSLVLLPSCSPEQESPEKKPVHKTHDRSSADASVDSPVITLGDISGKFKISTTVLDGRDTLKYLKKPRTDTLVFNQVLTDKEFQDEEHSINLFIIKFTDHISAEEEARINFAILENLLKKPDSVVREFEMNTIGDESMAISFAGRQFPLYLYTLSGNYFVKLNGGSKRGMEELIELARIIKNKIQ
ncbi:MAG: hypothetical protein AB1454_01250 [Candidatus Auribacterota bacterium]